MFHVARLPVILFFYLFSATCGLGYVRYYHNSLDLQVRCSAVHDQRGWGAEGAGPPSRGGRNARPVAPPGRQAVYHYGGGTRIQRHLTQDLSGRVGFDLYLEFTQSKDIDGEILLRDDKATRGAIPFLTAFYLAFI